MSGLLLRWACLVVLLGFGVRVAIAVPLWSDPYVPGTEILLAVLVGVYQDLIALVLLGGPLALAFLAGVRVGRAVLLLLVAVVLVVAFAELFFWWEFESRLNRLVFHYLLFPREVVTFLEDQFYVSLYAIPALLIIAAAYLVVRGRSADQRAPSRWFLVGSVLACVVAVLVASPLEFSSSRRINQMASNGYLGVLHAAVTDVSAWHGHYWNPAQPAPTRGEAPGALGVVEPVWQPLPVKHVVLIVEESFSGEVWDDLALRGTYMPRFSSLADSGVLFENVYSTGTRTTRGLEALLNGFPPLPGIAVNQRGGFERLPSLARALSLAGFHNVFVYGGWPGFSNFFPYWRALGYEELTSRDDFPEPRFETSWGVADEHLFEAIREHMSRLTQNHERVFLTSLTVSHHRPFDFPAGRVPFPAEERRSEYALAYADWALGQFIEDASGEPWFDDTLFVIAADHGPRISGDAPIPVAGFRVPLLLYAPAHLNPRRVDHLGSLMSFGVTLLELLGLPNDEGLYGDNLLLTEQGLVPMEHEYQVGLLTRDGLTVLHLGGEVSGWRQEDDRLVLDAPDWEVAARAARLFHGAHQWFYGSASAAADGR